MSITSFNLSDHYDFVEEEENEGALVGGRIQLHLEYWKQICEDRNVLRMVRGIDIPLIPGADLVQDKYPRQIDMGERERIFANAEIDRMLRNRTIMEIECPFADGFMSNFFLVPKQDKSWRFILNLKNFNLRVRYEKFKQENIVHALAML